MKRTKYKISSPIVALIVMVIGCLIHSSEFSPYPTAYYALTIVACGLSSFIGAAADNIFEN